VVDKKEVQAIRSRRPAITVSPIPVPADPADPSDDADGPATHKYRSTPYDSAQRMEALSKARTFSLEDRIRSLVRSTSWSIRAKNPVLVGLRLGGYSAT